MPEEKNPVDQVLDLIVFAPLGLAVTARTQLPEMVARGRTQVEGQITMARFIGQFAVKQGKVELEKRIKSYTGSPPAPAPAAEAPSPVRETASADEQPPAVRLPATGRFEASDPAGAPLDEADGAAPSANDLAIPGYDALSASQVVQRLAGLSSPELEQVRRYEAATRGRKTVLTKISQLQ